MRITVLAGGIGAARFLRGLLAHVAVDHPGAEVTVIGNTGDDITLFGLHVSPDLDTVMYTLGGGIHPEQGWGRAEETRAVQDELGAYGETPDWFALGDKDIATHLIRTRMLREGATLSEATAALCARWQPGVRLLPMSDDPVTTLVDIADADGTPRTVHFQEFWVRRRAEPAALKIRFEGAEEARPAPGVLAAIAEADVIVFPPSNPVVSVGAILAVPGLRAAVADSPAPVVGVSPIIGGAPVRGMADK
ncbi:2-phospho-L-lactate transferase, partial [Sporichthya sp.]|uniref:2-phospho-L-lactate transferase n=1 Tax=Sporichthya sp. TaxID=65475 RepID=UPI0017BE27DD